MQSPICIDDFGNSVYACHWTGRIVNALDAVISGGFYPGVKSRYIAVKDHQQAKKESHAAFSEMDANCNTCKNLDRIKHDKDKAGFLYGVCKMNLKSVKFHPDDWMGMSCWESR